jgi:hypothetical protein
MFLLFVRRLQPIASPIPGAAFSISAGALGVVGLARVARRATLTFLFLLGYLAIVAIWPFPPVRFLLGVWVLLMLVLACGVQAVLDLAPPDERRWHRLWLTSRAACGVASVVLVTGILAYNVRGYQRHYWRSTEEQSNRWIGPKLAWARANTDSTAIIGSDHDEGSIYLYTGRRSIPITTFTATEYLTPRPAQFDNTALTELARHFGARHLLVSSPRLRDAAAALGGHGVPLGDAAHSVVPWAYTVPELGVRARGDSLTLRASR